MTLRNKVLIVVVFVFALAVIVCVSPSLNFKRQLFQFGVLRGMEDRRSGIQYADDAPGWKILANSSHWTSDRKELARRLVVEPSGQMSGDTDAFISGYHLGRDWFKYLIGVIAVLLFLKRLQARPLPEEHSEKETENVEATKQE